MDKESAEPETATTSPLKRNVPLPVTIAVMALLGLGVAIPIINHVSRQDALEQAYTPKPPETAEEGIAFTPDGRGGGTLRGTISLESDEVMESLVDDTMTADKLGKRFSDTPSLIQRTDQDGWTFAHYAAAAGRADLLRVYLKHGGDVNQTDSEGENALHQLDLGMYLHKDEARMLETAVVLLDAGADPNAFAYREGTPTIKAMEDKRWALLDAMVAAGGDPTGQAAGIPRITVQKDKPYIPARQLLLAAGLSPSFYDRFTEQVDLEEAGLELVTGQGFSTIEGGYLLLLLPEEDPNRPVAALVHWPDHAYVESGKPPLYPDSVELLPSMSIIKRQE